MTRYSVTWGKDDRPRLHRYGCADVRKFEHSDQQRRMAWDIEAANVRDAMWQAGEEQRQLNSDPNDMDEDPGVDLMRCLGTAP